MDEKICEFVPYQFLFYLKKKQKRWWNKIKEPWKKEIRE